MTDELFYKLMASVIEADKQIKCEENQEEDREIQQITNTTIGIEIL